MPGRVSRATPPQETEAHFLGCVLEAAGRLGWLTLHIRPGRTAHGWATNVQGGGVGFPDCVMVHPGHQRTIFAELKREGAKVTPAQAKWLTALAEAGQECYVWTPSCWPRIERILRGERLPLLEIEE